MILSFCNCIPKSEKTSKVKKVLSFDKKNISLKEKLVMCLMKKKHNETSYMKLPYHSNVDNELDYAPCELMTKTENETPVLRDYEITRESVEIIFHEDTLSDSHSIRIQTHDYEQTLSHASVKDHAPYVNNSSALDHMRSSPYNSNEEVIEDLTMSIANEDNRDIYSSIHISFFDNYAECDNTTAFEATPKKIRQESTWTETPSLAESDYDGESSIDDDDFCEENLPIDKTLFSGADEIYHSQSLRSIDSETILEQISELPHTSSVAEFPDFDIKLSMALASHRKEALIEKHKIHARKRRRIRMIVFLMVSTCIVMVTIYAFKFLKHDFCYKPSNLIC